jgi:hypothetical protein
MQVEKLQDTDPFAIFIDDKAKDHKNEEGIQKIHKSTISSYPTPTNNTEMRQLIARAELEGDSEIVAVYDRALAPYCNDRRNLKDLLHKDVRFRFFCLDAPTSKANLIGILNSVVRTRQGRDLPIHHRIKNDDNSPISLMLKEVCTQNNLVMLRERYPNSPLGKASSEFAEEFLECESNEERANFFSQQEVSILFCHFLALLDLAGDGNKDVCNALFSHLIRPATWKKLSEEELRDFTWLVLHHPPLHSKLERDTEDQVKIVCKIKPKMQQMLFTASRFLLSTQSDYFQNSLYEDVTDTLDLSETSFDSRTIELLLRWISHSRTSVFAFDGETTVQDLEKLIVSIAAFGLTNQAEFEETMVMELRKRLSVETLRDITQIGIRYHLNLLVTYCVRFINHYEQGNLCLKVDIDGFYELFQSKDGIDLPEQVYETLSLLGPKIRKATIETFRPQRPKGCGARAVKWLSSLSHNLWDKCGGLIKRTSFFCLSIFAIEKMAQQEWMHQRDFPLGAGLGMTYPVIHKVFSKSIDRLLRNRPVQVVSLPGLIPLRVQFNAYYAMLVLQEKVYDCASACFRGRRDSAAEPLIPAQNPIVNALPNTLQSLQIARAADLTDEDCTQISTKCPHLRRLELGSHPRLRTRNFQFLTDFIHLQEISFSFERGEKEYALEQLRLDQLFPQSALKIEISMYDSTCVYSCYSFLSLLPPGATLHVKLKHAPLPSSLVLFESPAGASKAVAHTR